MYVTAILSYKYLFKIENNFKHKSFFNLKTSKMIRKFYLFFQYFKGSLG